MHTDDTWLFAALGSTFDLGGGWTGRIERGTSGKNYQRHVHVYKGEKAWSQNEDGSPHDDGNNSSGAPPKSVLKSLNKKKGWDWTRKENDWLNKIETQYGDSGYTAIIYPNGRRVTVFKQPGWYTRPYFPTKQEFRDYYYGPTYINFGSECITTASFPFLPLPGPISFPVPFPAPLPVW